MRVSQAPPLPDDILRRITADYPAQAAFTQVKLTLETLAVPEPHRVARCVLFAAERDFAQFERIAELARLDYRDAIMCGEYEPVTCKRLRNFSEPFD